MLYNMYQDNLIEALYEMVDLLYKVKEAIVNQNQLLTEFIELLNEEE